MTCHDLYTPLDGHRLVTDDCVWACIHNGELVGLVGGHADDYWLAGEVGDDVWDAAVLAAKEAFEWTDWESLAVDHRGAQWKKDPSTGTVTLNQDKYNNANIEEIGLNAGRKTEKDCGCTEKENKLLASAWGLPTVGCHQKRPSPRGGAEPAA